MELTDEIRKNIRRILTARPSARRKKQTVSSGAGVWPYYSDSLGVAPEQVEDAKMWHRANGIPTDFAPDGRAIITSSRHFRKAARAGGLFTGRDGFHIPKDERPIDVDKVEKFFGP